MNILAIETSGKIVSTALKIDNDFRETVIDAGFHHSETLMPAIADLFKNAGVKPNSLDLVACSAGPGSFTGLRIGMATAKGIAQGAQCALKAVPTLPLLAAGREHWPGIVLPIMDARKNRVYTAAFKNDRQIHDSTDMILEEFLLKLPPEELILATGPDAEICHSYPKIQIDPLHASGRGRAMIQMALEAYHTRGTDPSDIGPTYIRLSEAEEILGQSDER